MKHATYVMIGYCGTCPGAHIQLLNAKQKIFAQGVIDREQAIRMRDELDRYVKDGPLKNAPSLGQGSELAQ